MHKASSGEFSGIRPIITLLMPHINRVMSTGNTIATLTFPGGSSITEFIDALTSYFLIFYADTSASQDVPNSGSRSSCILHLAIYRPNGITVTVQQQNNPDRVLVQKARCVEKWHSQDNRLDNILIPRNRAAPNNSWVHQQEYYPANQLYAFCFSDRINAGGSQCKWECNMADGTFWPIVHIGFGVSIVCDAKQNPWNDNALRCTAKSMMHWRCFFQSYTHATCSNQRR
jgi:hypothetical protein